MSFPCIMHLLATFACFDDASHTQREKECPIVIVVPTILIDFTSHMQADKGHHPLHRLVRYSMDITKSIDNCDCMCGYPCACCSMFVDCPVVSGSCREIPI